MPCLCISTVDSLYKHAFGIRFSCRAYIECCLKLTSLLIEKPACTENRAWDPKPCVVSVPISNVLIKRACCSKDLESGALQVVLAGETGSLGFLASERAQARLNSLSNTIFPLPAKQHLGNILKSSSQVSPD